MTDHTENTMEKIISLAKRRGFIYQGSEIYGGLAGTWDYGPLGVTLKNNIKNLWWKMFVEDREDMYGLDAALLMNQNVWKASGHVAGFSDPLVEDTKNQKRYRADHVLEENSVDPKGMTVLQMNEIIKEKGIKSPDGNPLGEVRQFNMMLKTHIGPTEDENSVTYLRPETAGGIFVNFKNVVDSFHPKLPFGIAQIGKAFRNEISPGNFIFRLRELEQMEIEYFIRPEQWQDSFEHWKQQMNKWIEAIGLTKNKVHEVEISDKDRAHYSKRTIDFEFEYPFGQKELYGLAYRTDYDLTKHTEASNVDLTYYDEDTKERFTPHVIEPSMGVDRTILAVLLSAYTEDELGGETRAYLKLSPAVAPVKVAVFPLLKNKPQLVEKAREVYMNLRKNMSGVVFDDNGNIGKRYRRQDEIGTPWCITIDFDTLEDNTVTVRDRDSGEQKRVKIEELTFNF
ncbi:glycine--tRNA ligase [Candidatus Parcubacteria bacterium]|nr:glycine--tRNA ligase [Candidatus Parcubacteria bacterium]